MFTHPCNRQPVLLLQRELRVKLIYDTHSIRGSAVSLHLIDFHQSAPGIKKEKQKKHTRGLRPTRENKAHLGLLEDAEDGAGADGGVDVGGAVKGVEHGNELAVKRLLHEDGVVFLLGGDHAQLACTRGNGPRGGRERGPREGRGGDSNISARLLHYCCVLPSDSVCVGQSQNNKKKRRPNTGASRVLEIWLLRTRYVLERKTKIRGKYSSLLVDLKSFIIPYTWYYVSNLCIYCYYRIRVLRTKS